MQMCVITHRTDSERPTLQGYLTEILAVEGFLGLDTVDLTNRPLTGGLLEGMDLVLLASMSLDPESRRRWRATCAGVAA